MQFLRVQPIEEFQNHLGDDETRAFFTSLEIEIDAVVEIFQLLDSDGIGKLVKSQTLGVSRNCFIHISIFAATRVAA